MFEEAYVQRHVEGSMPEEEWRAWESTIDGLMGRRFLAGYWRLSRDGFSPSFARYLDERLSTLQS